MPTQPTELARIEMLLREQLAAAEGAEPVRQASRFERLTARLPRLTVRLPRPAALFRARQSARRPEPAEMPRPRSRLVEAARHEHALDELFPQESGNGPGPAARGRLPNLSRARASAVRMKDSPRRDWGPPPAVRFPMPAGKDGGRSDYVIAGLGLALGLVCAVFPWYIFFNQDQFGVQAIRFGGRGGNAGRATVEARQEPGTTPVADQEIPDRDLDPFATGTLQAVPENAGPPPGLDQQPFPAEAPAFHLVHVANGRAMIEDDAGLWVVQQGSVLPDSSVVRSIEQRNGRWVVVTSTDKVLEVSR